jgi:hypothetical protein
LKVSVIERRSGDRAHVAGGNITRRITELGVIDDVERLCTELSGEPFSDGKVLERGEVELSRGFAAPRACDFLTSSHFDVLSLSR